MAVFNLSLFTRLRLKTPQNFCAIQYAMPRDVPRQAERRGQGNGGQGKEGGREGRGGEGRGSREGRDREREKGMSTSMKEGKPQGNHMPLCI